VEFTNGELSEGSEVCWEAAKLSIGWRGRSGCFANAGKVTVDALFGKRRYEAAPPITRDSAITPELRASVLPEKGSFIMR